MRVGANEFIYEEVKPWGELPQGWVIPEVADVAVDSQDRLYVFARGRHPVIVLDREGHFLTSWGEGLFKRPHGACIAPDDTVYCVDDEGQAVRRFTPDGRLLMTITAESCPADTGYVRGQSPVLRAGPPFNFPTGVAVSPTGEIYVSDGYGNARIHKFAANGQLLFSWGEPGDRKSVV